MTKIRIIRSPYSKGTTLNVNGSQVHVPAEGETADVPAAFLPSLGNSHIDYEIVGESDEAGGGAGGIAGDTPAEIEAPEAAPDEGVETPAEETDPEVNDEADVDVDLGILDGSVPSIVPKLPGLSDAQVRKLIDAEMAGKTRTTLLAAMDERLNPPTKE